MTPLISFEWQAGSEEQIAAVHSMLISLSGLSLISFALWFKIHLRHRELWEENRVLRNTKFLETMIAKRTKP